MHSGAADCWCLYAVPCAEPLMSHLSSHVVRTYAPAPGSFFFQDICNSSLLCFLACLSFITRLPWPQALSSCLEVDVQGIDTLLRPFRQPARCTLAILCFMTRLPSGLSSSLKCDDPSEMHTRSVASPTPESSSLGIPGSFCASRVSLPRKSEHLSRETTSMPICCRDGASTDCFSCLLPTYRKRIQTA